MAEKIDKFHGEFTDFREEAIVRFNRLEQHLHTFELRSEERKDEILDHMRSHVTRLEKHTRLRST